MSPYDQQVYDAGFKYIPQSRFLLNPFQIPQGGGGGGATASTQPGLPSINMGGGGGGAPYTGGITGLTTDFQKAVDARTKRLEDAYNNPSTVKIFGSPAFTQDVNPADAGFYVAEDMRIPQQRTMLGKMFQPQSPREIMEQGYEPMTNIGILNAILGKADKFGTLPRADQAFITSQMGYTGPTVFGENQSGLSKDPFGLNTRSAFGNYAERVGVEADKLGKALTKSAAKRGLTFDASQGALVDAAGNIIDEDEYDAAMKDFINKTNLMRTKFNFYTQKTKERDDLRRQDEARLEAERQQRISDERAAGRIANQQMQRQEGGGGGSNLTRSREQGGLGLSASQAQAISEANRAAGMGGYGLADGGRVYYMNGGLADLVDIYD